MIAGLMATNFGVAHVHRHMGVGKHFARYWREKLNNPMFHARPHGGDRNRAAGINAGRRAHAIAFAVGLARIYPLFSLDMYRYAMNVCGGYDVNTMWISRALRKQGYTRKLVHYRPARKYTLENIQYYVIYTTVVRSWIWTRLRYYDESRFERSDLRVRRGRALRGRTLNVVQRGHLGPTESWSVTACIRLAEPPVAIADMRSGTNDAVSFLSTITDLIETGFLDPDSILIMDNARFHDAAAIAPLLSALLDMFRIRLVFLPSYSPELNPIETLFGQVKNDVRAREMDQPFRASIIDAFARVTLPDVLSHFVNALTNY